jgi:hypothetical protein
VSPRLSERRVHRVCEGLRVGHHPELDLVDWIDGGARDDGGIAEEIDASREACGDVDLLVYKHLLGRRLQHVSHLSPTRVEDSLIGERPYRQSRFEKVVGEAMLEPLPTLRVE